MLYKSCKTISSFWLLPALQFYFKKHFLFSVMVLKRQFGEGGSYDSPLDSDSKSPPIKFQKVVNYVMKEVSLQDLAMQISAILEPALRKVVKEEVEPLMFFLQSSPRHSLRRDLVPSRSLQLLFVNKLPSTIFTNSKVEDEEHEPLQIKLVDAQSKSVIHGLFSSIKVEIFALNGDFDADGRDDWNETEFNNNILRERQGKRPLLVGDVSFALVGGLGTIENITFTDNSSWVRSRKFKLGVRVVSRASLEFGIREAVSEAFTVLDHRGESYQKHSTPSLDDPVWRLKKISKQGASHLKLEKIGIKTVKDFLVQYHINSLHLRNVLGKGVANRTWDTMVKHANECHLDGTYYSYCNEAEGAELLFNCVYKVVAVKFEGQDYQPVDICQKVLVDKLKESAFMNVNQLIPVHNPYAISTSMQPQIEHVAYSSLKLDLQHDARSTIDQDEPEKQMDINLSDSSSYPCTVEDGYLLEDDSASQTNQPIQGFTQSSFLTGDYSAEPSDGAYNWYRNNPMATFAQNNQFGELSDLQTSPFCSLANNWGQGDGFLTTSTPAAHVGFLFQQPDLSFDIPGTVKSKAGWCKIRAAVMWKIIRRKAAARRKAKFSFGYH
ncbi:calmodulin-binding protein 60 B isoform X2 [Beta vulgaris subsp. vulgaris]|uniref:calmodulin-binding protein 60 B isoform X2 n=1 Tax=Beta vulgaris subsp. vulgaris TaxID=3555 RepID=UPI00053F7629|nr:calmodulin-binding protein 60 B isoform X2 [Beta vulgaris subsp. vulgaris]